MEPAVSLGTDLSDAPSITLTAADLSAIEGLQRLHAERSATPRATVDTTPAAIVDDIDVDLTGATCPVPGFLRGGAATCPVAPGARSGSQKIERSRADMFMRRLLRIPDERVDLSDAGTYRVFQRSMAISAVRCTLTYVIFPFVLPGISFLKGVGPIVGIIIGTIALVCDTYTVRRFFAVDHKYRWHFSTIVFGIMGLLTVLLVQDISHVVSQLLS